MGDIVPIRIGPRRGLRRATSARAWYQRGIALEGHDPAGAIHAYRRAIAGQPSFGDAHCNLGRLLHDAGDLAAAEACYRRALATAPDVALYHFNLGVALEDSGRAGEAIASYEQSIALDPALPDAHFNLARQLERAGDLCGAMRSLVRYRELVRTHQPIFR